MLRVRSHDQRRALSRAPRPGARGPAGWQRRPPVSQLFRRVLMNTNEIAAWLSNLLNREVTPDSTVTLTSGQRARFLSWLEHSGSGFSQIAAQVMAGRPFHLSQ